MKAQFPAFFSAIGLALRCSTLFGLANLNAEEGHIQGVILASHKEVKKEGIRGLKVIDVSLPHSSAHLEKKLRLEKTPLAWEGIEQLKLRITEYFVKAGEIFTIIDIPEQEVTDGVILFEVKKPKIGKISYSGQQWIQQEMLSQRISALEGQVIDEKKIFNDLAYFNENPFHYTDVIVAPGADLETTDLEFVTLDRFPWKILAGADNTGNEVAGRTRFFASAIWGNAWGRGDLLSYQFTSGFEMEEFHSHTLNSVTYLPWKDVLNLFASYASIRSDPMEDFTSHGKTVLSSLRYTIPLTLYYRNPKQEISAGLDYKFFTTDLFFVGSQKQAQQLDLIDHSATNVLEFCLSYNLKYKSLNHLIYFTLESFTSPLTFLPHQSKKRYEAMRKDAATKFFYLKIAAEHFYQLSWGFRLRTQARAQAATSTLLPTDQLSLGGYSTVRGYSERIFLADNGLIGNFEIQTKGFALIKSIQNALRFLVFMDYGWGSNYQGEKGENRIASLWSTGAGLRLEIPPYLEGRLDFGFKLHAVAFDTTALGRFHLALTVSY